MTTDHLAALFSAYEATTEIVVVPDGVYDLEVISVKVRNGEIMPVYRVLSGRWAGTRIVGGNRAVAPGTASNDLNGR